jgi:N utilization substance protein B
MSRRRKAREIALQTLYADELSGVGWEQAFDDTIKRRRPSEEAVDYAGKLLACVLEHREALDRSLSDILENWELERVSVVDRNILRIALAELRFFPETPTNVIINEAIEVAHRFSSEEAGRFVNGILDRLAKEVRAG